MVDEMDRKSSFLRLLMVCGLIMGFMGLKAQGPSAKGSFPQDGASKMIRNAFVSVALDLPGERLDLSTINTESVKLYPSHNPNGTVKAFVELDEDLDQLILEPHEVLAPNTTYTFEMTPAIKDIKGTPFMPYKISFETGTLALEKRITMNRRKRTQTAFAVRKAKPKVEFATAYASKEVFFTPKEKEERKAQAEKPKPKPMADLPKVDLSTHDGVDAPMPAMASAALPEKMEALPVVARKIEPVDIEPEENEEALPATEPVIVKEEETSPPPKKEVIAKEEINFPKGVIPPNGSFPIEFTIAERKQIKFQLFNKEGKVVKRQGGFLPAGKQMRNVPLKGVPSGTYRVEVQLGDIKASRKVVILK